MSDGSDTMKQSTPWHLWVIGAVSLLWNGFGGFDYVMTKTRNEAYLEPFNEEQLEFFFNFPLIANIGWGLGVWMSILGSILLLLRSKWAFQAYRLSLLGLIITTIYSYFIANGLGNHQNGHRRDLLRRHFLRDCCGAVFLFSHRMMPTRACCAEGARPAHQPFVRQPASAAFAPALG